MPQADSKKVQTVINTVGQQVQFMRDGMDRINEMKVKWAAHNPDVTGTPLDGNVAALNTAVTTLETALNSAVFTGLIAAISPTHENKALD